MEISIGITPGPEAVQNAQLAERLGFRRAWFYDSAALYEDIWITIANAINATTTIGVGTAVLVPNLRHVMTTASAIATIERMAPGRLMCGFGTGFTARMVLGKKALSWTATQRYVETLHTLLQGEVAEVEGEKVQMIHRPDLAVSRPINVPLLLSAMGPKGLDITRDLVERGVCSGLIGVQPVEGAWGHQVLMVSGSVLDKGESASSDRAKAAIGPWYVVGYHGFWEAFPEGVAGMPGGAEWLADVEASRPEGERHLTVHDGHVTEVVGRDRAVLDLAEEATLAGVGWTGDAVSISERLTQAENQGVTEILYTPAGPDVAREMRAFAAATLA
ncbi:MAG: LLM class flavin-dependent oxidoreductase [Acidimicrobiales bacterium]